MGLHVGLKVMILRGVAGGVAGVADVGGIVAFTMRGGGEDVEDGREEGLRAVDELCKEAEGLAGGEGVGDERKLRMGRGSTRLGNS